MCVHLCYILVYINLLYSDPLILYVCALNSIICAYMCVIHALMYCLITTLGD